MSDGGGTLDEEVDVGRKGLAVLVLVLLLIALPVAAKAQILEPPINMAVYHIAIAAGVTEPEAQKLAQAVSKLVGTYPVALFISTASRCLIRDDVTSWELRLMVWENAMMYYNMGLSVGRAAKQAIY